MHDLEVVGMSINAALSKLYSAVATYRQYEIVGSHLSLSASLAKLNPVPLLQKPCAKLTVLHETGATGK